jgi:tetratricopeptide (TPR) repeat protein
MENHGDHERETMKKKAPSKKPAAPSKAKTAPKAAPGKTAPRKAALKKPDTKKPSAKPSAKPSPKSSPKPSPKPSPKQVSKLPLKPAPKKKAPRDSEAEDAELAEIDSGIRAVLDAPASKEEVKGLEKVMASLSQIFGGKDFLSDAELDAFLDSKIASGEIPPSAALDPLDEAQSLIYEAWNSEGPQKTELARRALDLSKDCADAYVILAESDAKTEEAALGLFRKGVEAGQRAIDPGLFARSAGKFWDIMETRPYMRARLGLAECLWDLGKKEESLGHLRELMRLNPADDQGVRYILLQCLLESGADEELGALLDRYGKDTSPEIRYTHALWLFRREGPGPAAGARLKEAIRANPHVPAYLLKRKKFSDRVPASAHEGSEEEAEAYASGAADAWHRTLGALDWLASRSAV